MARHGTIPYLLGSAFHRLAFTEFGNPAAPAVLCVHGLSRNGRDFDPLAEALADRYHVVCPDLPGRGASSWLPDAALYQPASYVAALTHLLAHLNKKVAWIGTSLGGICGMMVAAAEAAPITRMVLNDIGPLVSAAALARIKAYMSTVPEHFVDLAAVESYLRDVHRPFGPLTHPQWRHLATHSVRPVADGGYALHFDPAIATPIRSSVPLDTDLGAFWDRIRIPVLAIRGETSDLLTEATFARMARSGAETLTIAGCGHAPALMDAASIAAIRRFLDGG